MWPDRRIQELFGIALPILQAPLAGAAFAEMVVGVSQAGGLGALACAMLDPAQARAELSSIRGQTTAPIAVNVFCHAPPVPDPAREQAWLARLSPYYAEMGIAAPGPPQGGRRPFDDAMAEVFEEFAPEVVSFHFGLPEPRLVERVRAFGAKIVASATSAREAAWLAARGCDAIIAQGAEAGGHRGSFLTQEIATQAGTMALVPQVVDAVDVPVIAAGGIADGRGIAAAFALGAAAVQIGTAYLFCPEARITPAHRAALARARDDDTAITNLFTGRPARGILNRLMREQGPLCDEAPAFPLAASSLTPLRLAAEAAGSGDFSPLWAGQAAGLGHAMPAGALTRHLAEQALKRLRAMRA